MKQNAQIYIGSEDLGLSKIKGAYINQASEIYAMKLYNKTQ